MPALFIPLLPVIGAKGAFTAEAPYNTKINSHDVYTVGSIRSIDDFFDNGETPDTTIYSDNGVSAAEFAYDHVNSIPIVGLQSEGGEWVFVPARYLTRYPRIDGVECVGISVVVSLPVMPVADTAKLTTLRQDIKQLTESTLGLSNIQVAAIENTKPVSISRANFIVSQDARNTAKSLTNYYTLYLLEKETSAGLAARVRMLEERLIAMTA